MLVPLYHRTRKERYVGHDVNEQGEVTIRGRSLNHQTGEWESPVAREIRNNTEKSDGTELIVVTQVLAQGGDGR